MASSNLNQLQSVSTNNMLVDCSAFGALTLRSPVQKRPCLFRHIQTFVDCLFLRDDAWALRVSANHALGFRVP